MHPVHGRHNAQMSLEGVHRAQHGMSPPSARLCTLKACCTITAAVGAGEWAHDLQDGLGTCQYMDGTEYRGRWKAGARHGRGVFTRPGGYAYDGNWSEDCPHGAGSCRFEDGTRHSHPTQSSKSFLSSALPSQVSTAG